MSFITEDLEATKKQAEEAEQYSSPVDYITANTNTPVEDTSSDDTGSDNGGGGSSVMDQLMAGDIKGLFHRIDNYYTNNALKRAEKLKDEDGNITSEFVSEAENGSNYGYDATGTAPILPDYNEDPSYDYRNTQFADNLPGHIAKDLRDWSNTVDNDVKAIYDSGGSEGKWKLYDDAVANPAMKIAATPFLPAPARFAAGLLAAPDFISGVVNAGKEGYAGAEGDGSGGVSGALGGVYDTVIGQPLNQLYDAVTNPGQTLNDIYEHPADLWNKVLEPGMIVEGGLRIGKKGYDYARSKEAEPAPEPEQAPEPKSEGIQTGSEYDDAINEACAKYGLDPALGHAVAQTESQHGASTSNVFGVNGITDPYESIDIGVKSLKRCIDDNGGDVDAGLREYNGNANPNYVSTVHQIEGEYGGSRGNGGGSWSIDMSEVGNTMDNHGKGCVEAVTKLGKNNDFLGRELDKGVVYVPKLIEDAKAEGRYLDYDPSKLEPGDVIVYDGDAHVMMYKGDGRIVGNSSSLDRIVERGLNEQGQTPTGIIKAGRAGGSGSPKASSLGDLRDAEGERLEAETAARNSHAFDEVNKAAEEAPEGFGKLGETAMKKDVETNFLEDPEEIFGKETKETEKAKEPAFNPERQDGEPLEDYANRLVSRAHETMEPEAIDRALKAVTDLSERQDALGLPDRMSILGLSDATAKAMKKLGDTEVPLKSFSETDRLVLKKAGYEGDTVNAAKVAADYDAKVLMDKMIRQRAAEIRMKPDKAGIKEPELRKAEIKEPEEESSNILDDPESWDLSVKDESPKKPVDDTDILEDPESWDIQIKDKTPESWEDRRSKQMREDGTLRAEWKSPRLKEERKAPKEAAPSKEPVEPITNKELRNRIENFGVRLEDSNFNEKRAGGRDSYLDNDVIATKHQNDTDAQVHHLADKLADEIEIPTHLDEELNTGLKQMQERGQYGVDKGQEYYREDAGVHDPDNRRFAFVNAVKEYLHDPERAKADFPQVSKTIETEFKLKGLEPQVGALQDGLYRMRNQSPEAAVEGAMEAYSPYDGLTAKEGVKEWASNQLTKFKTQIVDEDYGAMRFDKRKKEAGGEIKHSSDSLYDNVSFARGTGEGVAELLVEPHRVEDAGKVAAAVNKVFGEGTVKEHQSLHNIIQDYHQAENGKYGLKALNAYLAANTLHRNLKARENRLTSEINRRENLRKNKGIDTELNMDDSVPVARAKAYVDAQDIGGSNKQRALEKELHELRSGGYQMPWRDNQIDARKVVKEAPKEVKEAARKIYDYTDNLLNIAEKSGLISNKVHKALKGNFLPVSKAFKPHLESALKEAGVSDAEIKSALRTFDAIKGSNHDIHNVLEDIENYTQALTKEAARNKFVVKPLVKDLKEYKLGREVDPEKVTDESTVVFGWENGKRVAYDVQDPLIKQAIDMVESPEEASALGKTWVWVMDLWRAGTVNTFAFTATQLVRQFVDGLVLGEGKMYKPVKSEAAGLKSLKSKDQDYYDFKAAGISHSNMIDLDRGNVTKSVKQAYDKPKVTWKGVKNAFTAVPSAVESSSRLGKFKQDLKNGADFEDAVMNAKRVAVDFGRHGSMGKKINRYAPFFNAAIQGPRAYYRALFKGNNRKRAAVVVGSALFGTGLLWTHNQYQDWYQDMTDEEKSRAWYINEHLSIPKSQELGAACAGFENLLNATKDGKFGKHLFSFGKALLDLLPGKPTAGLLAIPQLQANYDLFTNRPIVADKYKKKNFDESYDKDKTSTMAVEIARAFGVNPAQAEYAIKSVGGQAIKHVADTADWARGNRNLTLGKALGFTAKFAPDKHSSLSLNDYYELKEKATKKFDGTKESPGKTGKYNTEAMKKNYRLSQMLASDKRDYMFIQKVEHGLKGIKTPEERQAYIKKAMRGYKK